MWTSPKRAKNDIFTPVILSARSRLFSGMVRSNQVISIEYYGTGRLPGIYMPFLPPSSRINGAWELQTYFMSVMRWSDVLFSVPGYEEKQNDFPSSSFSSFSMRIIESWSLHGTSMPSALLSCKIQTQLSFQFVDYGFIRRSNIMSAISRWPSGGSDGAVYPDS